ncbi:PdaC/SigV domain-containing protein [Paenibacillus protaetiae]|uniref:DUF4163 domain-containing protein n=1 Tax=Paenibacillus protaetiae TaxID=2509456 RepID=A0A4P6EYW1_9BACL|nr:DUF4163 domain-containing protein [Paenibacillus protaetiae]QAY67443.1 DUF4163 domain-containing protein [Paenibacillus protaetiae]
MRTHPFKMLTATVAGACLLAAAVPMASAAEAAAPAATLENISSAVPVAAVPISAAVRVPVTVTAQTQKETNDLYTLDMQVPVISGMADKQYEQQLNDRIQKQAAQDLEMLQKDAAEDAASAKEVGYEYRPHDLTITYELKSDGGEAAGGRLSLVVSTYSFSGGAHGGTRIDTYNVQNDQTASALTLEKLFGTGYAAIVNKAVNDKIAEEPDMYFPDAFTGITADHVFYVKGNQVFIVFQQYEIAPYAAGIIEIPVHLPDAGAAASAAADAIRLQPQGSAAADALAYVQNDAGVKLLPLRAVAEHFGYKVQWSKTGTVLSKDAAQVFVVPGKDSYTREGEAAVQLGAAPVLVGGVTYVPVSLFSDVLKLDVELDGLTVVVGEIR